MIVVYGANGKAGRAVCRSLAAHDLRFAIAGRSEQRLSSLADEYPDVPVRVAGINQHDQLLAMMEDADVLLNCAGPFAKTGVALIEAALEADCHYVDIAAEQSYVRSTYERFDSLSRKEGRVIACACAFDAALADWAAHCAASHLEAKQVDEITIAFAVPPRPNTKATQLAIVETAASHNMSWEEGRWVIAPSGSSAHFTRFPPPVGPRRVLSVPSPSVITVPRHVSARRVQSFVSIGEDLPLTRAASSLAPIMAPILSPLLRAVARSSVGETLRATIRSGESPGQDDNTNEDGNPAGRFALVAEARAGDEQARVGISGRDIYAVSAGIACLTAERLLNEGEMGGVLTPTELLDPSLALEEIAEQHKLLLEVP